MDKIISFDYLLTNFLVKLVPHNIFFDYFFSFFSIKGGSILIWITIVILLIIFEKKINTKFIFYFFIALGITSIVVIGLKNTTKRIRPTMICEKDFSFPSAHTATAFASAVVINAFDKKRKWFYYAIAVLISFSRIYLGCHYLLDVVTGAIIGFVISQLLLFFPDTSPFRKKSK